MRVKLKSTWFYPIDAKPINDKRAISGGRYRKGEHDMPDELRPYLPKTAVILDDDKPVDVDGPGPCPVVPVEDVVQEQSLEQVAFDAEAMMLEEAEEARQASIRQKRLTALEKARQAKKDKKDAK